MLAECNALVLTFPLFPPRGVAPRLVATLMGMVRDVHLRAAIFEGLGDAPAALALRTALVDGIEDDAMRELAMRDLAEPGAISRAMSAHQMALETQTALTGI